MNASGACDGRPHRSLGFLALAGSAASLTVMSLLVRLAKAEGGLTTSTVAFFRFLMGAVAAVTLARARGEGLRPKSRLWFVLRGTVGAAAVWLFFYGIAEVGLAKGAIYFHTYPMWAALIATVVLRERLTPGVVGAAAVAFGGLALVMWPDGGFGKVAPADLLALSGGALAGFAIVSIRKMRATDGSLVVFLSLCVFGVLVTAPGAVASPPDTGLRGWELVIGVGAFATAGQLLLTWAYRHVRVGEAAPFAMLGPVLSALVGVLYLQEPMSPRAVVGGAVVIAACTYASMAKRPSPAA
ncbi:MAG: DMT family transporter [Planctomycetota bacterium]